VKGRLRRVLVVMLMGLVLYGAFVVWRDTRKIAAVLTTFRWHTFGLACAFAFCNYVLRFFKWEFYLARLDIRGVRKLDSFLTFLSGFVLTVTPGKVGEVFKSLVLFETYQVPMARTAPIVIAERVTDVIGIVLLIVVGSLGFHGGLVWAGVGSVLVLGLLVTIANRRLSLALIGMTERLPGKLGKLGPKLHAAYDSLATMLRVRNLAVPTLLSLAAWAFECMSLWIILQGFGQSTSIPLCAFFYATSTLAGALVPVPGGLGVTEGALLGQMTEMGKVNEAVSTAAMILVRFSTLWFAVLVGFVALTILKRLHPTLLAGTPEEEAVLERKADAE
jgi:uncharacterized protein (TIRG00374 family)